METSTSEKTIKQLLVHKGWQYLYENFHKFTDTNKIKIALELCKKDMPTQIEGEVKITQMQNIQLNGNPIDYDIGGIGDRPLLSLPTSECQSN